MPPSHLILVRHGETDWNHQRLCQGQSDIPLNDRGRDQARRLTRRLRSWNIEAIHSSDLLRASQTAEILGESLGLTPRLDSAWREMNLGVLEGQSHDKIPGSREIISASAQSDGPFVEGAETYAELEQRVVGAYMSICSEYANQDVMIVSHGGTLKALIAHVIHFDPKYIDRLSLRGNSGVSVIDFRYGRPQLVLLNDTHHLAESMP